MRTDGVTLESLETVEDSGRPEVVLKA